MTATETTATSEQDRDLVRRVDSVEKRVLERGGTMVGSAIGLGSIIGSFAGPGGTTAGALIGLVAGYLVPRLAHR